jgi:hypothetical protein
VTVSAKHHFAMPTRAKNELTVGTNIAAAVSRYLRRKDHGRKQRPRAEK